MRASRLVLVMLLLSSVLVLTDPTTAQSVYGQVLGRLTSASGTPISSAVINMISVETGVRTGAKSDTDGSFAISNVSAGLYQTEIRADGFKRVEAPIVVSANSATTVNVRMQTGDPNTIVENTGAATSVLELDRTDVSTFFDSRAIAELPLLDRNLTRLALLVPGAARARLAIAPNQNPQGGQPVDINGQHFSGSAFQLDGTENRDPLEGIVIINPPLDSVREMKVTTQGYNAEFGQATAGVVTIQTRSGSNSWHGDAFGYRRTGWAESVNPFAPAGVPPSKHGIFGGALGGPIAKNKLFLFGDYQGTRSSQGANLLLNVPTPLVLSTCLGSKGAPGSFCDLSEFADFISNLHDDNQHLDPKTQKPIQYPDNKIPNARISDQAVKMLALLPSQNRNGSCAGGEIVCNNFLASGAEVLDADLFDLRSDYNVSSAVRVFGRYSFGVFRDQGSPAFGPSGGGFGVNPQGFAGVTRTRNQGIAAGFTYSLSPKILTDFRFGYFRYRLNNNSQDNGQVPDIGIPGIFASDTHDSFATGLPDIQIPGQKTTDHTLQSSIGTDYIRFGYSPTVNSCNCPLREREQQFQFVNNWTRSAGKHLIKWGADLRYLQNYRLASDTRRTGYLNFAPNITGLGLATFLIGDVASFDRFFSSPAAADARERQKRFGFYGQDTWRISSRLTLNYGLRWEIYFPQTVTGPGRGGFLLPSFNNHDPSTTFFNVPPATDNAGNVSNRLTNLAPRLGIAYLVNPSTVIRAGYGRSFDAGYAGDTFGIAATQNPPVTVDQNIQGGFTLSAGPPPFFFPSKSPFSLLDLASANIGDPTHNPPIPASGAVLYALPSRVRVPTVDSWNLTIQHELASRTFFELAYVGNKGTRVFPDGGSGTFYNLNQPTLQGIIIPVNAANLFMCRDKNVIFTDGTHSFCLTQSKFRTFYNRVEAVPDNCPNKCFFNPILFPVQYFGNNASDNYNSLQARLQKNFSRGYSFMAHYTWSKGLDYDSNYFRVDPRVGYGPATFDVAHRFVLTNIWDLPIGRGRAWLGGIGTAADRFVGGWTMSAITIWRSGLAFTPSYSNCPQDLDTNSPCRPNVTGLVHTSGSREDYFSTTGGQTLQGSDCIFNAQNQPVACGVDPSTGQPVPGPSIGPWQRPGAGQIGNVGRNSLRGPSFFQSDIALDKVITITERTNLHFRADAFNVFNKVNLGNPNPCVDCQRGGTISSLTPGAFQRTFQFSLRFQF